MSRGGVVLRSLQIFDKRHYGCSIFQLCSLIATNWLFLPHILYFLTKIFDKNKIFLWAYCPSPATPATMPLGERPDIVLFALFSCQREPSAVRRHHKPSSVVGPGDNN